MHHVLGGSDEKWNWSNTVTYASQIVENCYKPMTTNIFDNTSTHNWVAENPLSEKKGCIEPNSNKSGVATPEGQAADNIMHCTNCKKIDNQKHARGTGVDSSFMLAGSRIQSVGELGLQAFSHMGQIINQSRKIVSDVSTLEYEFESLHSARVAFLDRP